MKRKSSLSFSPDGNGIPKSESLGVAWDIVDSGTGFERSESGYAP